MASRYSKRRALHYPRGPCLGIIVLFSLLSAQTSLAGPPPKGQPPPYRQTFDSGVLDWMREWDTNGGADSYKSFYRVDRMRPGFLFGNRQSYYSDAPHDYFNEEVAQVIRGFGDHGFWDVINGNWVSRLNWSPTYGWYSAMHHDWSSSIELQEGALLAAIITGNRAMDQRLSLELRYMHDNVAADGQVSDLALPRCGTEYGVIISALALGALYFTGTDEAAAQTAFNDLRSVCDYVAVRSPVPRLSSDTICVIMRGYAHACRAFDIYGDAARRDAAASRLGELASLLIQHQDPNGAFDLQDDTYRVQKQLKADIALLLAHGALGSGEYLASARKNFDWVIANRLDCSGRSLGGLTWYKGEFECFFEVHQMWFLIVAKYLEEYTGVSYAAHRDEAVAFLTDDNFAGVDMYTSNMATYHAFFSYRAMSRNGAVQEEPFHQWKGAYEIGASLWAMALNHDSYEAGHSWLAAQAHEDSSDGWDKAIFSARNFRADRMTFRWEAKFKDARFPGAHTGLFNDRRGDWRILLNTAEGLAYKDSSGATRVLVGSERLASGRLYTVRVEARDAHERDIYLLEDAAEIYAGSIKDAKPFDACYFGVFQDNGGAMSAKNIYVDNVEFSPTVEGRPRVARLFRSFPNPFNDGTTIELDVKSPGRVRLDVYDASGRHVASLADRVVSAGLYRLQWDGRNANGRLAASGVYVCRLEAPGLTQSEKIVLSR